MKFAMLVLGLLPVGSVAARAAYESRATLLNSTDFASSAQKTQIVCSNTSSYGDNGGAPAGYSYSVRRVYYCPHGATGIQLLYTGVMAKGSPITEQNFQVPIVRNISVEQNVPPPYDPTQAYAAGARVSFMPTNANSSVSGATAATYAYNPYFVALQTVPAGTYPTPTSSTYWGPDTPAAPVRVTCGGYDACVQGTRVSASSVLYTLNIATDYMPITVPVGGYIAVREWITSGGSAIGAMGVYQSIWGGAYNSFGTATSDVTLSGNRLPGNGAANLGPFAIVGQPVSPTPSVCVIGDSRTLAFANQGAATYTIVSGGSGYNVGNILTNPGSGASADNVVTNARAMVLTTTTGGVISALGLLDTGQYADPAQDSTTQPTAAQTLTGGDGSGASVSFTYSSPSGTYGDFVHLANGPFGVALGNAGVPWTLIGRAADQLGAWMVNGDRGRIQLVRAAGCSSVIDELDINDSAAGISAATSMANHVTLANQLLAMGVRGVFLSTTPPTNGSTDHWATAGNQSLNGSNSTRVTLNSLKRAAAGAPPFAGIVDLASGIEANSSGVLTQDGGYARTTGTAHQCLADGTHFGTACQISEVNSIAAIVGSLK